MKRTIAVLAVTLMLSPSAGADNTRIPSAGSSSGGGGGTQYSEGGTAATITGTAAMWEDTGDTLRSVSAAKPLPVNIISGAGSGGTAAADDSAFTVAATNVTVMGCIEATDSVDAGDLGGVKCGADRELDIDIVSSTLPTGAATLAEQQTQTTALQIIDNLPVAQGSTTSGQSGALTQGAVTTSAPTYTTAQTSPLSLTTTGSLRVEVAAVTAVGPIDGSVMTPDIDEVSLMAGCVTSTSVSATDRGCVKMLADRRVVLVGGDAAGSPTAGGVLAVQGITSGTPVIVGDGSGALNTIIDSGTVAATQSGTWTMQPGNTANTTAWKVDGSAVTQPVSISGNQAVNVAQINGVTPLMGNGASGTGAPRVTLANDSTGQVALAAGSALVGQVTTGATASTTNSTSTCYITSAASTNSTNCKASAGNIYGYDLVNTTSTLYYLRMYDLSSAPTCSSATGFIRTIPIPHGTGTGAGIATDYTIGAAYTTGIGFCLTGGGSSTDNTNAATGVYVAIRYK